MELSLSGKTTSRSTAPELSAPSPEVERPEAPGSVRAVIRELHQSTAQVGRSPRCRRFRPALRRRHHRLERRDARVAVGGFDYDSSTCLVMQAWRQLVRGFQAVCHSAPSVRGFTPNHRFCRTRRSPWMPVRRAAAAWSPKNWPTAGLRSDAPFIPLRLKSRKTSHCPGWTRSGLARMQEFITCAWLPPASRHSLDSFHCARLHLHGDEHLADVRSLLISRTALGTSRTWNPSDV